MAKGKFNHQRLWLVLFLSALIVAPVSGVVGSWWEYRHLRHIPGRVEVFIGIYPNVIPGQKASLLRLS